SQYAFTATSIGTASSVPQIPQTKLQKISPMKIATSLVRAVRLVSQGVNSQPSTLVIASEIPDTYAAIATVPNWRKATIAVQSATITGPKYGTVLKMPAAAPQSAACLRP